MTSIYPVYDQFLIHAKEANLIGSTGKALGAGAAV